MGPISPSIRWCDSAKSGSGGVVAFACPCKVLRRGTNTSEFDRPRASLWLRLSLTHLVPALGWRGARASALCACLAPALAPVSLHLPAEATCRRFRDDARVSYHRAFAGVSSMPRRCS